LLLLALLLLAAVVVVVLVVLLVSVEREATFHLYPQAQRPRAGMGRAGSAWRAMASGQKMLKTLFLGRRDWRGLVSEGSVSLSSSSSSGESLGVSGGEGGSDWKVGRSELVDQMAVRLSKSTGSGRAGGGGGGGAGSNPMSSARHTDRGRGIGISCGTARPVAKRRYCSARAVTQLMRILCNLVSAALRKGVCGRLRLRRQEHIVEVDKMPLHRPHRA